MGEMKMSSLPQKCSLYEMKKVGAEVGRKHSGYGHRKARTRIGEAENFGGGRSYLFEMAEGALYMRKRAPDSTAE